MLKLNPSEFKEVQLFVLDQQSMFSELSLVCYA